MTITRSKKAFQQPSRMRVLLLGVLALGLLLYHSTIQAQAPAPQVQPQAIKPDVSKDQPISIPSDLFNVLRVKELELQNIELQIRLVLNVPNDYTRQGDKYVKIPQPPQVQPPKVEKKDEKSKANP